MPKSHIKSHCNSERLICSFIFHACWYFPHPFFSCYRKQVHRNILIICCIPQLVMKDFQNILSWQSFFESVFIHRGKCCTQNMIWSRYIYSFMADPGFNQDGLGRELLSVNPLSKGKKVCKWCQKLGNKKKKTDLTQFLDLIKIIEIIKIKRKEMKIIFLAIKILDCSNSPRFFFILIPVQRYMEGADLCGRSAKSRNFARAHRWYNRYTGGPISLCHTIMIPTDLRNNMGRMVKWLHAPHYQ